MFAVEMSSIGWLSSRARVSKRINILGGTAGDRHEETAGIFFPCSRCLRLSM